MEATATARPRVKRKPLEEPRDHVAIGLQYAQDVVSGKISACRWVKLACQRQLSDLEKAQADPTYPWVWNPVAAGRPVRFIELGVVHIKGPKAGQPMRALAWQCFALTTLYGWYAKEDPERRRYRQAYWEVPKGNGKTFLGAGLELYALAGDDEGGAEVYSAAVSQDQARLSFEVCQATMRHEAAEEFRERRGISVGQHAITHPASNSFLKPLSSEHRALEGKNIHFGLLDEVAVHPTRLVYDSLVTALSKRKRSLILSITTAGIDVTGIGHELREMGEAVLEGRVDDASFFPLIYTIDPGDDWTDPTSWAKANPGLGESTFIEYLAQECARAKQVASRRASFLTRFLNVWQTSMSPWIAAEVWKAVGDAPPIETMKGLPGWQGLDLASKSDLASRARVFRRLDADGVAHFYAYVQNYLNEQAVLDSRNASYRGWSVDGHLTLTPGNVTDHARIEEDVLEDARTLGATEIRGDPWQWESMRQRLAALGLTTIEVKPGFATLSAPMKELEALVLQGRFHHDGSPVTAWAVGNTKVKEDGLGNIFPTKAPGSPLKIDPVLAILTALTGAILPYEDNPYSAGHGFLILGAEPEEKPPAILNQDGEGEPLPEPTRRHRPWDDV